MTPSSLPTTRTKGVSATALYPNLGNSALHLRWRLFSNELCLLTKCLISSIRITEKLQPQVFLEMSALLSTMTTRGKQSSLRKTMTLVLGGDQCLTWMDGRWQYHSERLGPTHDSTMFSWFCMGACLYMCVCVRESTRVSCIQVAKVPSACKKSGALWRLKGRDGSLTSSWLKGWRPAPAEWRREHRR